MVHGHTKQNEQAMTKQELRTLRRVATDFGIKSLRWGTERLVPSASGLKVEFQLVGKNIDRVCHMSFRYNGDEVVFVWKAYWTPQGIFWWEHDTYNMRTGKPMRRQAAMMFLIETKKRAQLKSVDTKEVTSVIVDGERILSYKGHTFKYNGTWLSYHDEYSGRVEKYLHLCDTIKEAKVKAMDYVKTEFDDMPLSIADCK